MSHFLGPDGQPMKKSVLTTEHSGPTVRGVRQVLFDQASVGLTPQRLAQLLREADDGGAEQYLSLAEEMEEKDLHYLAVLGTRKRAVSQLEMTVEPASDDAKHIDHADLVRDFLHRDAIEEEIFDILDAIGKGFSATEIIWETSEGQWMPERLEWRDPRWFEFDRDDGRILRLKGEGKPEDLPPYKYIVHFHKAKSGIAMRGGLARAVAWAYLFKNFALKDWIVFAEVYGQPIRVGKYGPNATEDEKKILLKAVANIGTDAAAIVPESMLIEFVKAEQRASADLYKGLANYLDQQVSKAVLGQTTTTDAISGGHAVSKEHNEVRHDIERSDAKQLAATLTADIAIPIIDLNHGPQKAYPKIRIGRPEGVNIAELTDGVAKLVPLGFRVDQQELRQKMNLKDPDKDAELLTPTPTGPPAPPAAVSAAVQAGAACPGCGQVHAARSDISDDSIDDLVDGVTPEAWAEIMDPIMKPLVELAAKAETYDEFAERLAEVIPDMDADKFGEILAEAQFQARIGGNVEVQTRDDDQENPEGP